MTYLVNAKAMLPCTLFSTLYALRTTHYALRTTNYELLSNRSPL